MGNIFFQVTFGPLNIVLFGDSIWLHCSLRVMFMVLEAWKNV